ncbi:MAG: copper homeostasis membrane protein CopD, partial [Stellaceae bacterium]
MHGLLITARFLHYAATISLAGAFAFSCLVAAPTLRRAGAGAIDLDRRRGGRILVWASLALALVSGAGWLVAIAAEMSGRTLAAALAEGDVGIVLTQTRFGTDWLLRLGLVVLLGLVLLVQRRVRRVAGVAGWIGFGLALVLLASLAWAGHGAATPGAPGDLHLAADILHLLAAGMWLGTLAPLALLLTAARRAGGSGGASAARFAVARFSVLAIAAVVVLLGSGLVNTWFLAGTVPALVGTPYGRLLLGKIALFLLMLTVAAVNLLRFGPRLAGPAALRSLGQLRRNALIEAAIGLGVLAIVGALGILPPGLHTEPGWPFPFRLDLAALASGAEALLALLAALFLLCAVALVAAAAAGRYRRSAACAGGLVLCLLAGFLSLRPAVEPAYPTSFYAPAEPYNPASIVKGAAVYAANCALCHGASGKGDGPAAAGLPIRPANLTEPHLFAHSPGDLFWWVGHGRGGVMPGFAQVLPPGRRWDVINFVRARAAGDLVRQVGP